MARSHHRSVAIATAIALGGTLSACFTTTADFRNDAETFIVEDDNLRTTLLADSGAAFATATCAEPADQDEGTTFTCTAVDSTGASWEFEILITGSSGYEVNLSRAPEGA